MYHSAVTQMCIIEKCVTLGLELEFQDNNRVIEQNINLKEITDAA
jgi:hypothetical protein